MQYRYSQSHVAWPLRACFSLIAISGLIIAVILLFLDRRNPAYLYTLLLLFGFAAALLGSVVSFSNGRRPQMPGRQYYVPAQYAGIAGIISLAASAAMFPIAAATVMTLASWSTSSSLTDAAGLDGWEATLVLLITVFMTHETARITLLTWSMRLGIPVHSLLGEGMVDDRFPRFRVENKYSTDD